MAGGKLAQMMLSAHECANWRMDDGPPPFGNVCPVLHEENVWNHVQVQDEERKKKKDDRRDDDDRDDDDDDDDRDEGPSGPRFIPVPARRPPPRPKTLWEEINALELDLDEDLIYAEEAMARLRKPIPGTARVPVPAGGAGGPWDLDQPGDNLEPYWRPGVGRPKPGPVLQRALTNPAGFVVPVEQRPNPQVGTPNYVVPAAVATGALAATAAGAVYRLGKMGGIGQGVQRLEKQLGSSWSRYFAGKGQSWTAYARANVSPTLFKGPGWNTQKPFNPWADPASLSRSD